MTRIFLSVVFVGGLMEDGGGGVVLGLLVEGGVLEVVVMGLLVDGGVVVEVVMMGLLVEVVIGLMKDAGVTM